MQSCEPKQLTSMNAWENANCARLKVMEVKKVALVLRYFQCAQEMISMILAIKSLLFVVSAFVASR